MEMTPNSEELQIKDPQSSFRMEPAMYDELVQR